MKPIQLVFYEKVTKERDESSPVTLEFQGRVQNNPNMPKITLKYAGCDDGQADNILEDLGIIKPGETLYLIKGINPQRRLDDWLPRAEKRKTSQVENFKKEIEDFNEEMLKERYEWFYDSLSELVNENKQDTKKFDLYLEFVNVIRPKLWPNMTAITKDEMVNATKQVGVAEAEEPMPDENSMAIHEPEEDDEPEDDGWAEDD